VSDEDPRIAAAEPPTVTELAAGRVVASGLYFPEGLRWHDGHLWFSDVFGRTVNRLESSGPRVMAQVPGMPSGLGWTPDGTGLVVSMTERVVLEISEGGTPAVYADLSGVLSEFSNDMLVDSIGRAYVGNYGFDVDHGAAQASTHLVRIDPDRSVHVETPDLLFPNGMALVDDGTTLLVAETFGERVTALRVGPDGSLGEASVLVDLPAGSGPDGIAVDAQGRIWIPCAFSSRAVCVARDGTIEAEIVGEGVGVNCCAVGDGGTTLFVAVAPMDESEAASHPAGSIMAFPL
jgi:sugar lactone lactonase YvrE